MYKNYFAVTPSAPSQWLDRHGTTAIIDPIGCQTQIANIIEHTRQPLHFVANKNVGIVNCCKGTG